MKKSFFSEIIFIIFAVLPLTYFVFIGSKLYLASAYFEYYVWHEILRYVFYAGLVYLLISVLRHRLEPKLSPSLVFFLALAVWMLIATYVTGFDDTVFKGVQKNPQEGLMAGYGYFMFLLLAVLLRDEKQQRAFIWVFVLSALILQLALLYEFYFTESQVVAMWTFYNPNHFGYYLISVGMADELLFLTAEKKWQKIFGAFLVVIGTQAVVVNDTLGTYVGLLFGLLFIPIVYGLINRDQKLRYYYPLILTVATAVVAALISSKFAATLQSNIGAFFDVSKGVADLKNASDSLGSGRLGVYRKAVEMIAQKPLFGWGWQAGTDELINSTSQGLSLVHCEYLQYAVLYGIPAAVLYVLGILSVFIRGLKHKTELTTLNIFGLCVAFGYAVSASFGNQMFFTAPFFFIFLGFGFWTKPSVNSQLSTVNCKL